MEGPTLGTPPLLLWTGPAHGIWGDSKERQGTLPQPMPHKVWRMKPGHHVLTILLLRHLKGNSQPNSEETPFFFFFNFYFKSYTLAPFMHEQNQ